MASGDFCEHDWPGSGCPDCREAREARKSMRYVVIDTETTGFPEEDGRLVEVAALSRRPDGSLGTFEELCDPGHPIPPQVMAVHHITNAMVAGKPSPRSVVEQMLLAMGTESETVTWVAHNMKFDEQFLPEISEEPKICTYRAALHLWPEAPTHSNQGLRYWLDLDSDPNFVLPEGLYPHRALYDIIVTEGILRRMIRECAARTLGNVQERGALEHLAWLRTQPATLYKIGFGKHRGWKFVDLPTDYMGWYLRQPEQDPDVKHTMLKVLDERRSGSQRLI